MRVVSLCLSSLQAELYGEAFPAEPADGWRTVKVNYLFNKYKHNTKPTKGVLLGKLVSLGRLFQGFCFGQ